MKQAIRSVALLMCVVILVLQLISCKNKSDDYVFEVIYPSVTVSSLEFTLNDEALVEFKDKLSAAKELFQKEKGVEEDEFRHALYELLSLEANIGTQADIAYMLYYYDTKDTKAWDNYLYAYNMCDEAHDLFWEFYNEARYEDGALSKVFEEVIEKEYQGHLVTLSDSSSDTYRYEMETLEKEYDSLRNSNASDSKIFYTYRNYMIAAYKYAKAVSAANYYEYSKEYRYYRGDTAEQRNALRQYTKEYLVPLYKALAAKSQAYDRTLSAAERNLVDKYLSGEYNSFEEDYLFDYFSSLSKSSGQAMTDAFEKDRVLIGDKSNSYNTAMVCKIGNTPICYFHKSKTTLDTMSHELGHYYANVSGDSTYYSFDLRETHSTANTMLLYSYLSQNINNKAFTSAELYMISNWVYQTISSVIRDEFDEKIYTCNPSVLKLEDIESIMSDLIDEYGVRSMSTSLPNQLMTYWKRLGITYPMSNYCYATAYVAALQIYIKSKDDYVGAAEMYRKIVEEPEGEGDFISTIVKAGLTTPYDEQTYIKIKKLTEIN